MLRTVGVCPTSQRLAVAAELLTQKIHLSAEEITLRVNQNGQKVSRATVYNTLKCFVDAGLIRQVFVGSDRVLFDSNTQPHHHFFDPGTEQLIDIDHDQIQVSGLPELPEGRAVESLELVIRLKPTE